MEQNLLRAIEELKGAVHSVDTRAREIDERSRKIREESREQFNGLRSWLRCELQNISKEVASACPRCANPGTAETKGVQLHIPVSSGAPSVWINGKHPPSVLTAGSMHDAQ